MKANINIIAAMMLFVILASCSNKDDRMLTVIHEDGTCSREYTFHSTQQVGRFLEQTPCVIRFH